MTRTSPAERSPVPLGQSLMAAANGDESSFLVLINTCDGRLRKLASALLGEMRVDRLVIDVWRCSCWRISSPRSCSQRPGQ
jgi:hypothetical protein